MQFYKYCSIIYLDFRNGWNQGDLDTMAALFKKKNKTTIAELEEYYAKEKTKKRGRARLMVLISFLFTLAVIAGLFFGGRWLYETLTDNNNDPSVASSDSSDESQNANRDANQDDDAKKDANIGTGSSDSQNADKDTSNDGSRTDSSQNDTSSSEPNGGVVSDQAATTDDSNQDNIANNENNPTEIPNTGSGEFVLLLASLVAAGYLYSRNKLQKNP